MRDVVRALCVQLNAPAWAGTNLDALSDVLRDLSWLPPGPVVLELPDLAGLTDDDRVRLLEALARAVDDSAGSARPLRIVGAH